MYGWEIENKVFGEQDTPIKQNIGQNLIQMIFLTLRIEQNTQQQKKHKTRPIHKDATIKRYPLPLQNFSHIYQ